MTLFLFLSLSEQRRQSHTRRWGIMKPSAGDGGLDAPTLGRRVIVPGRSFVPWQIQAGRCHSSHKGRASLLSRQNSDGRDRIMTRTVPFRKRSPFRSRPSYFPHGRIDDHFSSESDASVPSSIDLGERHGRSVFLDSYGLNATRILFASFVHHMHKELASNLPHCTKRDRRFPPFGKQNTQIRSLAYYSTSQKISQTQKFSAFYFSFAWNQPSARFIFLTVKRLKMVI